MALSDAEVVDLRRFLGYPADPTPNTLPDALTVRVTAGISPSLEAVVRNKLFALTAAEQALADSYAGLDTQQAAVYVRDLDELTRRTDHMRILRMDLAAMLAVETGPWLGGGAFVPAVLVV